MTNEQSLKRTFDEISPDADQQVANIFRSKHMATSSDSMDNTNKFRSTLEDFCDEIFLEIFQYLYPMDLLYSFSNLCPRLNALIKPYTHTLDIRFINRSCFQCLTQTLLPCFIDDLRVFHLSNANTFGQISDMFYKFDWSKINQIESLTLDLVQSEELSKYCRDIHPLLKHLWRLSLTFDEHDKTCEKLLIDRIFIHSNQSLTSCFITGITFDLNRLLTSKVNHNLRELTLTLGTINDLIILFRHLPNLENLICTIVRSTSNESIDKISPLQSLTILTIKIEESITFKNLQKILVPHTKIKTLSLQAILRSENSSTTVKEEIDGFALEKFFRTFLRLTELQFYLRQPCVDSVYHKSDESYLFSFTSHFWIDRSIKVFTHLIDSAKRRYIYTLPFPFDTFDITGDIDLFLHNPYPRCYTNICHLLLSSAYIRQPFNDPLMISKYFPNIQTITFSDKSTVNSTIKIVAGHQWILQRSELETPSKEVYPCVYLRNSRKLRHWYFETLEVNSIDQRIFANTNTRVRQLTIYKMTEQQTVSLTYFFPWINVLILHVNTLEWLSASNNWLHNLLTTMTPLFSLTIYYPKNLKNQTIQDMFINTLFATKKHFFFKCNDGIVNIWF